MIDLSKIESLEECAELLASVEARAAKERSFNEGAFPSPTLTAAIADLDAQADELRALLARFQASRQD